MDILNWWKGLENALDAATLRQQVIANNIANAGTPGYRGKAVAFEEEMRKALAAENDDELSVRPVSLDEPAGISGMQVHTKGEWEKVRPVVYDTGQPIDINQEMVNLAKNQIQYTMLTDKISGMMSGLTKCIDEVDRR